MMNKNLCKDIINGKVDTSAIDTLVITDLKKLKKNAQSIISRTTDAIKYKTACKLVDEINNRLTTLDPDATNKAQWKTKPVEQLSLEDINNALRQSQWYKSQYGPAKQAIYKEIAVDRTDARYDKATRFLDKAPDVYNKALQDEQYWSDLKDRKYPNGAEQSTNAKLNEVKKIVETLETMKLNKNVQFALKELADILK